MKTISRIAFAFSCLAATANTFAMDAKGWASTYESMAAFEDKGVLNEYYNNRPGYVKPIIDNLGNVLNSNWYVSANVPQSLTFEVGMPFSIVPIGDDDRKFTETFDIYGTPMAFDVPTIFGEHGNPQENTGLVYGNETLNGLGVFTYPYLQVAGSFYHARVVLRGMFLPSISNLTKFNLFGFGLQYSFGHLFQYMLPPAAQGLDVSFVFGYSTSGIGYRPDEYKGSLDLDVSATTFDVVIGYKPINFIEVMMTLGYQSATMKSSGHMYQVAGTDPFTGAEIETNVINPNISVDGNNGFKFGLAVAFQFGSSFHPVLGFDYAGKSSYTTNVLYFRQQLGHDKTPDEIAKEKGYVRGAVNEKEESKVESVQEEAQDSYNEMNDSAEQISNEEPVADNSNDDFDSPSYDD